VLTSKPGVYARRILEHAGLTPSFDHHGPDLDEIHLGRLSFVGFSTLSPSIPSVALVGDAASI
jgi:hypothetical protein